MASITRLDFGQKVYLHLASYAPVLSVPRSLRSSGFFEPSVGMTCKRKYSLSFPEIGKRRTGWSAMADFVQEYKVWRPIAGRLAESTQEKRLL
jgi:hypothetical protein